MPDFGGIRQIVSEEAHKSSFSIHQDVSGFETYLLVVIHEERDSLVCREVLDLSDDQGRAPEAARQV